MPRVEHCRVDIAVRGSVADPEEHELPVEVRVDLLPCGRAHLILGFACLT